MKKQFYRVKQLADQTFSRSGKGEALSDELLLADRKVEHLRNALQLVSKRLSTGAGSTLGQDPAAREKRLKKIPEYMLGLSMTEAGNFDDDASILKFILCECGNSEKYLANEMVEHELKVEDLVCAPLTAIADQDVPAILKAKKNLSRMISDKDSAANRYHHLERQIEQNPVKLISARDELEEAASKVEAARDCLAADLFSLVAKETQLAHTLLQYVKLQRAYHESALHFLQDTVPELERIINNSAVKPVFGYPLEEHLRVTGRRIAFPIEICVCMLLELGLNEEGVFRITGSSTKVRRMKLSLDAGLFSVPPAREYRDPHVVAAVLKGYLRELPEPLLAAALGPALLRAAALPTPARLPALAHALAALPGPLRDNLRYLVKFLAALTDNRGRNRMSPANLAIVIAPNLFRSADLAADLAALTAAVTCVVELLISNADYFFEEDVDFFLTYPREDYSLPDPDDYGPSDDRTAAPNREHSNGDHNMSKSACEGRRTGHPGGDEPLRHSRSNSHDTSLILLDDDMKKAQSNSSLSDQSSPPQGSPKPFTRRKNKPLAPGPPVSLPDRPEIGDKPAKPPRPVVSDTGRVISGVQTINRSTYKQSKSKEESCKSGSRENLFEGRRQSLEMEKEKEMEKERPVAAPRSLPGPAAEEEPRGKPAVPSRPASLRPPSLPAQLERAHLYSVDKQQPTVIRVGEEGGVQRTLSQGGRDRAGGALSRHLSHSEGSITEPEPRARPPRPALPPPPAPDSTDL